MAIRILVYGTGSAGTEIALRLSEAGADVTIAGRDLRRSAAAGRSAGVRSVSAAVHDRVVLSSLSTNVDVIVNAAGPYRATALPMMRVAVDSGSHYLDVSNEGVSFASARAMNSVALERGVALVPGVGFGVAVSELAAHDALITAPRATHLHVVFAPNRSPVTTAGSRRSSFASFAGIGAYYVGDSLMRNSTPVSLIGPPGASQRTGIVVRTGDLEALRMSTDVQNISVSAIHKMNPKALSVLAPALRAIASSALGLLSLELVSSGAASLRRSNGTPPATEAFVTVEVSHEGGEFSKTYATASARSFMIDLASRAALTLPSFDGRGVYTPFQALGRPFIQESLLDRA